MSTVVSASRDPKLALTATNRRHVGCCTAQPLLPSRVRVRRSLCPSSKKIRSHVPRTRSTAQVGFPTIAIRYPIRGTILCRRKGECLASFDARLEPARTAHLAPASVVPGERAGRLAAVGGVKSDQSVEPAPSQPKPRLGHSCAAELQSR